MSSIYFLIQQTLIFSIPLLIVAIGAMFSERSGVCNIALEGTMILSGFTSILFINKAQETMSGQPLLLVAAAIAVATGAAYSLMLAVAAVSFSADQTIVGAAMNMFAPAFAIFFARLTQGAQQIQFKNTFRIEKIPVLGDIPVIGPMLFQKCYITTYIGVAILIAAAVIMYKTKYGLRLRACGEYPAAADTVGINVSGIRYSGVIISGALAGLGGLVLVVPTSTSYNATVAGYGFLAMAVLIFGQWKPLSVFAASVFFGFMKTISSAYSVIPMLNDLQIPTYFYKITPYVATIIMLVFTSKNSRAPESVGVPYDKSAR